MESEAVISLIKWGLGGLAAAGAAATAAVWGWCKLQIASMQREAKESREKVQAQLVDCEEDRDASARKHEAAAEVLGAVLTCATPGCNIARSLGLDRREELKRQLEEPRPEKKAPSPSPPDDPPKKAGLNGAA